MYVGMMHVCMMQISMVLDPHYDGYIYDFLSLTLMHMHVSTMHVRMMHVCMMHISMTLDPHYDGYIYDFLSLTLMHIIMYP